MLFFISVAVVFVASFISKAPDEEQIQGLTYSSMDHEAVRKSWTTIDIVATVVILGLIGGMYLYFSLTSVYHSVLTNFKE